MKFSDKDRKELLPEFNLKKEHNVLGYLPLFSAGILLGFTTASTLICFVLTGFVSLAELPTAKASCWTSGILLATLPGYLTVWTFHYLAWNRIKENQYKYWIFFSCLSGILSQTSLVLLGISPVEGQWLSDSVLVTEDQVFLSVFLISSFIFACFSFNLSLFMNNKPLKSAFSAPVIKVVLVALMMIVALAQGFLSLYTQVHQTLDLGLINDIIQYVCFYLHLFYFSSLYIDLSEIKFCVDLGNEDYDDSAFASTF